MTERGPLVIDIEAKSKNSTSVKERAEKPLWTRSDNSFRFNFHTDSVPLSQEETFPSDRIRETTSRISFTGQSSAFAFNFHIPPGTQVEDMDTTKITDCSSKFVQEKKPSLVQEAATPTDLSVQSKAKKKSKKKPGTQKPSGVQSQQKSPEEKQGGEELSAEEQLNRQLDWCMEQLEIGIKSQKGTPKQKEEASHALKTLRSSKAPLVKKRQVMRAMTGDYRKKMDEEQKKQFRLIQGEVASAHVKVKADSTKKSVFHRRTDIKTKVLPTEENPQPTEVQDDAKPMLQTQEETSAFVFVPSKEEFSFNFF
ncbi:UPF0488 protein C8orf33 homolog [Cololabis saira]|uniref:UPF0488 protein C8orf33 homolog n=1 Tax=Cololabis saira TaxID=129043 RepID=UPI002AD3AE77|nr:UPF0488 protein C8orf33 homolog [Cololabis saira]